MDKWQSRRTTTPLQETPPEQKSQPHNEKTAEEIEETRKLLIGALLTQASCTEQFATSLLLAVRSNLGTPRTVEALSFALSEMVNLSTSMCDQVKALTNILQRSRLTTPSDREVLLLTESMYYLMQNIVEEFDL